MSSNEQKMICNKNDGAPEQQEDDKQPHSINSRSSSINDIDAVAEGIESVTLLDSSTGIETCAACGKEGNSDDMNTCNKCKSVKYCNAACKKKHRSKHKKACERRVAELYDEKLFKDHPPNEECPLCFLPLSHESSTSNFMTCCGKVICIGCIYAMKLSEGKNFCAFCRTPYATSKEEELKRINILLDKGNAKALYTLGGCYEHGFGGLSQDYQKACELWLKAGELGCADGYYNLGVAYEEGMGVEDDKNKAKQFYELAAMGGSISARHNLGALEYRAGNQRRAFKHLIMSARAGHENSLDVIKHGYMKGFVNRDEYANTLRAYHERQQELKSDMREKVEVAKMRYKMRHS